SAELRELRLTVWRAALTLPPQQRLALALREWQGRSYGEIAAAMRTRRSAVEALLFRARRGFRQADEQARQPSTQDQACVWCLEQLSASVEADLSAADQGRVDGHVRGCPTCKFAARELQATSRHYALLPFVLPLSQGTPATLTALAGAGATGSGAVGA